MAQGKEIRGSFFTLSLYPLSTGPWMWVHYGTAVDGADDDDDDEE